MCSIVGSLSRKKLFELCDLNMYRGAVNHSISYYNIKTEEIVVERFMGPLDTSSIRAMNDTYYIVHLQAPTGQSENIHPAELHESHYLWHNGIIKESKMKDLEEKLEVKSAWDTDLLLRAFEAEMLDEVDGSFSCLLYSLGGLYLFRNEIAPMFYDHDLSISSTKFTNSMPTDPNNIFWMDLHDKSLVSVGTFTTKENPYYFE